MSTQLSFDFYEVDVRSTVLQKAEQYVTGDRSTEHGDVEES